MSRPRIDADIENRVESVTAAQNSTLRWPPWPNFLKLSNFTFFEAENKLDLDPHKHCDTSATYWKLYDSAAENYDQNLVDGLKANTSSMVFLNTLFSAIVASFIIEIYKTLQPSNGQDGPPSSAVRINIVLFLSFFLSVMSAVGCALIQKWCDEYKKFAYPRASPHTRGFMNGIYTLLHISVFLFFWAISDFFHTVNHYFGTVTRYALIGSVITYMVLTILPLIFINSPYNTPMTGPLRVVRIVLRILTRTHVWFPQWFHGKPYDLTGLQYYEGIHLDKVCLYSIEAEKKAKKLEPYAMKWLFTGITDNDFSDSDMDKFLEGLPGYMSSKHTDQSKLYDHLTADYIKTRIKGHFISCATSVELTEEASIARVFSCAKALRLIFDSNPERNKGSTLECQRYFRDIIVDLQALCDAGDSTMALHASCIRGLAVHGILSLFVPLVSKDHSRIPVPLILLYNVLFPNNKADTESEPDEEESRRIWRGFQDAPLVNLTMLGKAVRDKETEHEKHSLAPSSKLSFCWKTFDILLTEFGTIYSDPNLHIPTPAQSDFDNLQEDTRKYVLGEEMGFRMSRLLETLDIVDRGRRLSMVFSSRPKYQSRAAIAFEKEYLRNRDLLEAFAHCLPRFIAKNSLKTCMDLMEKVVCRDDLWSNLQMVLSITQKSTGPTSDKFRVFECCCNVLDAAFRILEDSRKVDWHAPEFGSLWQHFESFITDGFQGAFMGRAASFRIGIIKARFCKILLTQFWNNVISTKILSFRSQWDVASLAKLINNLGLRDKDDPDSEFWNSYLKGGHIGEEFTAKALKMVDIIASDGPLTIFCQLGHLAISTIPSHHSGLKPSDIEKVLELQDKLVEDKRLSFNGASDKVREYLNRLQEQVNGLLGATPGGTCDTGSGHSAGNLSDEGNLNAGREVELLNSLLRKIDEVRNLRDTGSEGPGNGGHVEERPRPVPEESGPHTISSSQSTDQVTLHVEDMDSSSFKSKGVPVVNTGSPTPRQNPQRVSSGLLRNSIIVLENPMI